jgi:putative chitinase
VSLEFLHRMFARPRAAAFDPLPPVPIGPDWPAILRAVGFAEPAAWASHIAFPAARRGIHAGKRAAAFAATIAHESDGGRKLVESLNYSPAGLRATWPNRFPLPDAERMGRVSDRPADQRAIAERAYGGRMGNAAEGHGDGFLFRGRGLIQLTGRDAYRVATDALGLPILQQPDLAAQPNVAAEVAAWTWAAWKGCNPMAEAGDVIGWRRAINGGLNGLDDVRQRYEAALRVAG